MKNTIILSMLLLLCVSTAAAQTVLFDPATTNYKAQDIQATLDGETLRITNKKGAPWPGFTVQGKWSMTATENVVAELVNDDDKPVTIALRFDSTGGNPDKNYRTFSNRFTLGPKETRICRIIPPGAAPPQLAEKLVGMRGYPGGVLANLDGNAKSESRFDSSDIVRMIVYLPKPTEVHRFGVRKIRIEPALASEIASVNEALTWPPEKFFPMIDRFGQYKHADWPGKIKSVEELKKNIEIEDADLKKHPGPKDRNRYGGWTGGPQLKATGHFRAEKLDGKWWIVDPEGRLFWSHGPNAVRTALAITGITDREYMFEEFPTDSYGTFDGGLHNFYGGKKHVKIFNFTVSNLKQKYGDDWRQAFNDRAHLRLRSWGMNTIGNWSESGIYELRRTPYTAISSPGSTPVIRGSQGHWGKFRDPFSPAFRKGYAEAADRLKKYADDPWCLGFYIDNELGWGDDVSLAVATLQSPADQPAKIAFVEDLKKKYGNIGKLNTVWGTDHADWSALLASEKEPERSKAGTDLKAFYARIAGEYFRIISEELKRVAPDKMYFGCRFSNSNPTVVRIAAKYCDLVSFNIYSYTLDNFSLPEGVDKGVIIGEFHFGALDRGMFHTGLRPVKNQQARAEAYETYVTSGLRHPNIVGVHWFLYGDQAATGRPLDGENYQIGLLDVCDTPYPETIRALRNMGENMYKIRSEKK